MAQLDLADVEIQFEVTSAAQADGSDRSNGIVQLLEQHTHGLLLPVSREWLYVHPQLSADPKVQQRDRTIFQA